MAKKEKSVIRDKCPYCGAGLSKEADTNYCPQCRNVIWAASFTRKRI